MRLNISRSGPSVSFGRRGLWYTVGRRRSRITAGLPGTGVFYTRSGARHTPTAERTRAPGSTVPTRRTRSGVNLGCGVVCVAGAVGLAVVALAAWPVSLGVGIVGAVLITSGVVGLGKGRQP